MAVSNYAELVEHRGHEIEVSAYGPPSGPTNVALECMTCSEVLLDYERPTEVKLSHVRYPDEVLP